MKKRFAGDTARSVPRIMIRWLWHLREQVCQKNPTFEIHAWAAADDTKNNTVVRFSWASLPTLPVHTHLHSAVANQSPRFWLSAQLLLRRLSRSLHHGPSPIRNRARPYVHLFPIRKSRSAKMRVRINSLIDRMNRLESDYCSATT